VFSSSLSIVPTILNSTATVSRLATAHSFGRSRWRGFRVHTSTEHLRRGATWRSSSVTALFVLVQVASLLVSYSLVVNDNAIFLNYVEPQNEINLCNEPGASVDQRRIDVT
jgi:hypothetical protein